MKTDLYDEEDEEDDETPSTTVGLDPNAWRNVSRFG